MGANDQPIRHRLARDPGWRRYGRLSDQQPVPERLQFHARQPPPRAGTDRPDWRLSGTDAITEPSLSLSVAVELHGAAPVAWRRGPRGRLCGIERHSPADLGIDGQRASDSVFV